MKPLSLSRTRVYRTIPAQRARSTYMVECRVSILGITIMVWEGIPHNSTLDPLGLEKALEKPFRVLQGSMT